MYLLMTVEITLRKVFWMKQSKTFHHICKSIYLYMVNDFKLQDLLWLGWNAECTTVGSKWIWGLLSYLRGKVVVHTLNVVVVHKYRLNVAMSSNFLRKAENINIYVKLCDIYVPSNKKNVHKWTAAYIPMVRASPLSQWDSYVLPLSGAFLDLSSSDSHFTIVPLVYFKHIMRNTAIKLSIVFIIRKLIELSMSSLRKFSDHTAFLIPVNRFTLRIRKWKVLLFFLRAVKKSFRFISCKYMKSFGIYF